MLYDKIEFTVFSEDLLTDISDVIEYGINHDAVDSDFDSIKDYVLERKHEITGNDVGSYTHNRETAKENVLEYFGIFYDAVEWYNVSKVMVGNMFLNENWECMDIICREYIFDRYLDDILEEILSD